VVRHSQIAEFVRGPAWLRPERLLFDVRGRRQDGSGDFRIEVLNTATKKRERFLDAAISPAVSPDGKWIACVSLDVETGQENILVMDSDRGNVSRLLGEFSSKLFIGSLAWSPDGNDLAFAAADPFAKSLPRERRSQLVSLAHPTLKDVWLIRRDGSNLRRLADLGESQPSVAWASNPKFVYVLGFRGLLKFNVESGAFEERGAGTYGGQIASVPR
jgi:Tol biopolymer transport system component